MSEKLARIFFDQRIYRLVIKTVCTAFLVQDRIKTQKTAGHGQCLLCQQEEDGSLIASGNTDWVDHQVITGVLKKIIGGFWMEKTKNTLTAFWKRPPMLNSIFLPLHTKLQRRCRNATNCA